MRWDELFADMEAQLAQADQRNVEIEAAETARAEFSKLSLSERLAAHRGHHVRVLPASGDVIEGVLADVGAGWVVLNDRYDQVLVPLHSVVWWEGLRRRFHVTPEQSVLRKLSMGHVLRALSQSRAHVRVRMLAPTLYSDVEGTIDGVGQDFLDVALHPNDQFRRRGSVSSVRTVPFSAVATVSSMDAV